MSVGLFDSSKPIPIFPLPNAVLLPGAVMPLHIFEQRYRLMTRDALSGPRLIAMAKLKPGYEPEYHTQSAEIHPTLGIGRIIRDERLADGRYNLLLQGLARGTLITEDRSLAYRRGWLEPVAPQPLPQEVERAYRCELYRLLTESSQSETDRPIRWLEIFRCADLSFSELLDTVAAVVLQCPDEKQRFLAEPQSATRAKLLCGILETSRAQEARAAQPRDWPPRCCGN